MGVGEQRCALSFCWLVLPVLPEEGPSFQQWRWFQPLAHLGTYRTHLVVTPPGANQAVVSAQSPEHTRDYPLSF